MQYPRLLAAFFSEPWAIEESKYYQLREFVLLKARGLQVSADDMQRIVAASKRTGGYTVVGKTAIIPISGVIAPRVSLLDEASGGIGAEDIGRQVDAAVSDKQVSKILFDIDSPGGSVFGLEELANKMRAAGREKKTVAIANHIAASAAYMLAAQANELYVTPSGMVGSVGTISEHVDVSKLEESAGIKTTLIRAGEFKQETHPAFPLTEGAAAYVQTVVNKYYGDFVSAVAKGRTQATGGAVSEATVRENYGKGRMLTSQDAKDAGMVDGIVTLERLLARMAPAGPSASAIAARMRTLEIDA